MACYREYLLTPKYGMLPEVYFSERFFESIDLAANSLHRAPYLVSASKVCCILWLGNHLSAGVNHQVNKASIVVPAIMMGA